MLCKQCGAQIRREDRQQDGLFVCPGCGKRYRVKQPASNSGAAVKAGGRKTGKRSGRKGLRRFAIPAAVAAVAVVALLIVLLPGGGEDVLAAPTPGATIEASPASTAVPTPAATATPVPVEPASVHFRAVGDVMAHKLQLTHAKQDDGSYSFDSQFEYVKDALSKADYTIANLELTIATNREYSSFPFFRTPEAILDSLKDCGVDLFTMANNHVLDGFYEGLVHTIDEVEARGFDHVGAYRTAEEAAEPLVVEIGGIRFGFLAYTKDTNDNEKRISADQARFCVKRLDEADFKADVKALRDLGAEVVICLPHWGTEERRSVSGECKRYAQAMVEAGVDIILGSHPHVVLPIQLEQFEVDGQTKDVLVAWSMGNFISYMAAKYMDSGIIVDFTVSRDENGKISIHDVGYVPVYVWGRTYAFHLLCSGDFYNEKPSGMSSDDYSRMKKSVREIVDMIGQDGITLLQN